MRRALASIALRLALLVALWAIMGLAMLAETV